MINITKPIFNIALISVIFASCKTANVVTVPQGVNTVINISEKKVELSDFEKDNWQHLDLATDTIPGMSINKAYDFLQGKTGVKNL